jgi:hypothetical protein
MNLRLRGPLGLGIMAVAGHSGMMTLGNMRANGTNG